MFRCRALATVPACRRQSTVRQTMSSWPAKQYESSACLCDICIFVVATSFSIRCEGSDMHNGIHKFVCTCTNEAHWAERWRHRRPRKRRMMFSANQQIQDVGGGLNSSIRYARWSLRFVSGTDGDWISSGQRVWGFCWLQVVQDLVSYRSYILMSFLGGFSHQIS